MKLGHEKLAVYRQALEHVTWMHRVLMGADGSIAVVDHWVRAAESVLENIANGNSRRSRADRNYYFDVALGSGLECAACLDICERREILSHEDTQIGKRQLQPVVKMVIKLREAESAYIREQEEDYEVESPGYFFAHEQLDAYQVGLELISWFHQFMSQSSISSSYAKRLDKAATSLVLNIAEGNGKFSKSEQVRFLDIAHTCAMRFAACLDVLAAKEHATQAAVEDGKDILVRAVPLILGLRAAAERELEER